MFDFTFGGGKLILFSSRSDYNFKLEFVAFEETVDF